MDKLNPSGGWLGLSVLFVFAAFSQQTLQQHDPKSNFCRRFGHQTAVVDRRLYVDGGLLNWNPMTRDPGNYTNTWLSYHDLDDTPANMPNLKVGLNKNASIPSVHGGALWADDLNYRLFLFGGEFETTAPTPLHLLSYDIWYDQWDDFGPPGLGINRVSYGASTNVLQRGEGYYYGGYLSEKSVPGWSGGPLATTGMIRYDMNSNSFANITGPDGVGRAEGVMTFIPVSDNGMLIYFGGVQDPFQNGTLIAQPLDQIFLYDVVSTKWHIQTATGTIPENRRRFCAGAVWAKDQSSYNIYLNSGAAMNGEGPGWDDVYILSIPSFTWIKTYPLGVNGTGQYPSHSLTCNIINDSQMLAIGGTFPNTTDCDYPDVFGVHNIDLGAVIPDRWQDVWAGYQPDLEGYQVPYFVSDVIGGDENGGATKKVPENGWGSSDLGALMTIQPIFETRKRKDDGRKPPDYANSTSGSNSNGDSDSNLSTGTIVGIAVGGGVGLIALLTAIWYFYIQRKKDNKNSPPVEMPASPLSPYTLTCQYHGSTGAMSPQCMHSGYGQSGSPLHPGSGHSPGQNTRPNWSWSSSPSLSHFDTNRPSETHTSSASAGLYNQVPQEMDAGTFESAELNTQTRYNLSSGSPSYSHLVSQSFSNRVSRSDHGTPS